MSKQSRVTIIQVDKDGKTFVFHPLKSHLNKWIKNKELDNYLILNRKDLDNECALCLYEYPLLVIIDSDKHYFPSKQSKKKVTVK